jgi:two-component system sensor histidine kinase UhpB
VFGRVSSLPLFWRVFGTNALVLTVATLALIFSPVTVSVPVAFTELVILLVGLLVLLGLNLALLRPAFRSFDVLADTMREHDPLSPGDRAHVDGGPDVAMLAQTFNEMLDRLETERRESARMALVVQEGERRRIARELHDEVGQTLTAVALRAESAAENSHQDAALREIGEAVQRSLDDLRRIANRLRPEALDDLGLVNALIALCNRVSRQGDIAIRRNLAADLPELAPETELVIYRVAQEALTNVLRHASATRAAVSLLAPDGRLTLTVSDNGRGLTDGMPQRTGVAGMRERALLIGGDFAIGPARDGGVEVRLALP